MNIIELIGGAVGSMIDPINLAVAVVSGLAIRRWWLAIFVGAIWQFILHFAIRIPANNASQLSTSTTILFAGLLGTFVVTSGVWAIARYRQRTNAKPS